MWRVAMRRFRRIGVVFGLSGALTFGALGVGLSGASAGSAPAQTAPEGCATFGLGVAEWERSVNDGGSVDYLFTSYMNSNTRGASIDRRLPSPRLVRKYLKQARAAVEGLASLEGFKAAAASIAASEVPDASRIGTTVEDALDKHKKKLRRTVKILETMLAKSLEKKAIEAADPTAGDEDTEANEYSTDLRGFSSHTSFPGTTNGEAGSETHFSDDEWVTQGPAHPLVEKYNRNVRSLHLETDIAVGRKREQWVGPTLYRAVGDAVAFCAALATPADAPDRGRTPNTQEAPPVTTTTYPTTTTTDPYCYEDPPGTIVCT
jgi:hypothetical protein